MQMNDLTPALVVERLRATKQDIKKKDAANVAKDNRGAKSGQRGRSQGQGIDKSNVECYGYHQFGHYKPECPNGQQRSENGNKGLDDATRLPKDRKASDKPASNASKPPAPERRDRAAVANESEGNETNESVLTERVWMTQYGNEKTSSKWLLDSEATRHMTLNRR